MHITVVQLDCCGEHSPFRCGPYEWYNHLRASQESLVKRIVTQTHKQDFLATLADTRATYNML